MRKRHRMPGGRDFLMLLRRGKKLESRFFSIIVRRNAIGYGRLAVMASMAVARRAVQRNRLRRRVSEWIRTHTDFGREPYDMLIILKKEVRAASRRELYEELSKQCMRTSPLFPHPSRQ